jgi:hypothetical protein
MIIILEKMKIMLCKFLLLLQCCLATEPNQTLSADQPMGQIFSLDPLQNELNQEPQLSAASTLLDELIVPPYFVDQMKAVNLMLETYLVHKVTFLLVIFFIMGNQINMSSLAIAFIP